MENIFENASLKDGFAGDRRYLKGFIAKMNLIFALRPDLYETDESKVIYVISRFYGNAMNWAATLIENDDPCLRNYPDFINRLKSSYGCQDLEFIANRRLKTLKQKRIGGINGYISEFNHYADDSSWNETAKMDAFMDGLQEQIATRIYEMFPGPRTLLNLQNIACRIDSRLAANQNFYENRSRNNTRYRNIPRNQRNSHKEKNNIHGPLSKEEKERRRRENLCMYCGRSNHILDDCPLRKKKNNTSSFITDIKPKNGTNQTIPDDPDSDQYVFDFDLIFADLNIPTKILIDTGSQYNLIDSNFVTKLHIPIHSSNNLPKLNGIGGSQSIIGITIPLTIKYDKHQCKTTFYVTNLPTYCCILGVKWLIKHNPSINFSDKSISFNSKFCISNCIIIPESSPAYIITSNKNESEIERQKNFIQNHT